MSQLNRREFLVTAAATCAGTCCCGSLMAASQSAQALDDAPTSKPAGIKVGMVSDYKTDGITDTWLKAPNKIAVVRHEGKIYACTSVCTHRGVTVVKDPNVKDSFHCPAHGSEFDIDGNVSHGPASKSLNRYAISKDDDGTLWVDKSKTFGPDQWTDSASFVSITPAT
jgi:Rieske Fe-S protein